jgi:hypothetical protein
MLGVSLNIFTIAIRNIWGGGQFAGASLNLDFTTGDELLDPRITFTRASNATVTGPDGTLQYAPHNLLTFSEQVDNSAWSKTASTVTANITTAPDGTITADKLVENTATSQHLITQSFPASSGVTNTLSVFAKSTERFLTLVFSPNATYNGTGAGAFFNLSTGVVNTTFGTVTASITPVGDGWFRCSIAAAPTATGTANANIGLSASGTAQSYLGDGTSGIFLWGAQLNVGALQPYYPTTTAAYQGPRFDYDPVTLAPRGLLIEEQRTNSIRNNMMVGAVAGTPGTLPTNWGEGLAGLSREIVSIGAQNGINYVDIRLSGTTTATQALIRFEANNQISAASGQTWTSSFYCSVVSGATTNISTIRVRVTERDAAVNYLSEGSTTFSPTTTLTRYSHTRTLASATTAFLAPDLMMTFNSGVAIDITLRIGMPQLELGAFATSVIPTTTEAATRAADVAVMTGANFSNWYNQSAGSIYWEGSGFDAFGRTMLSVSDGTTNNRIRMVWSTSSVRTINTEVVVGNVFQGSVPSSVGSIVSGQQYKLGFTYATDDLAGSRDGGTVGTDTSALIPVVDRMYIGAGPTGAFEFLNGHIRKIAYYPRRLSDAELQAITS